MHLGIYILFILQVTDLKYSTEESWGQSVGHSDVDLASTSATYQEKYTGMVYIRDAMGVCIFSMYHLGNFYLPSPQANNHAYIHTHEYIHCVYVRLPLLKVYNYTHLDLCLPYIVMYGLA